MKKITLLVAGFAIAISSYAQTNTNCNGCEKAPNLIKSNSSTNQKALWGIQLDVDPTAIGTALAGAAWTGTEFWVAEWNSSTLYTANAAGASTGTFTIAGVSGTRSITTDGTDMYIGTAGTSIYKVNPTTKTLTGTITTSVASCRYVTFDPTLDGGNGGFWCGAYGSDIVAVSMTGTTLSTITSATHGLTGIYGMAHDTYSAGGPFLWAFDQGGNGADIVQLTMAGVPTGLVHDATLDLQGGNTGIGGGLFICNNFVTGQNSMIGICQGASLFSYELSDPANDDAEMFSITIPSTGTSGTAQNITGVIKNNGGNAITSLAITWNDGTTSQTDNLTGLNIAPSGSYNFTHANQWTPSAANGTSETLTISVSNPNGNTDPDLSNNSLTTDVFLNLGVSGTKHVLLEEFTTAACTYCPDGAVVVEAILAAEPNVIAVGHHSGYGTDAMTIPTNTTYSNAGFSNGAPTASIDRVYQGISRSANGWVNACASELAKSTPVNVAISGTYNSATRMLDASVTASFVDYAIPGDLRLNLFIIEDHVTGTGSGYNQVNGYNTVTGHTYFGAGNPIVGYDHRHVMRAAPSTDWGTAGIISGAPQPSDVFSNTYSSISINNAWDENEIHLVAFVSYYDADTKKRIILNSYETTMSSLVTDVSEILEENNLAVYPNPTNNVSTISFDLTEASSVNVEVYNTMGSLVFSKDNETMNAGTQKVTFDGTELPSGIYFVNVTIDEKVITRKVSLLK